MITPVGEKTYAFRGLSTDSKPIEKATNGSSFIEIDTGKVFLFDAANTDWKEFTTISISGAGGAGGGIDIQVLDELPSEGKKGVFYLVPSTGGDGTSNYDQYVWDTNSATFKKIGSAGVSLVDYYTKSEVNDLIPDVSGFITEIPAEYITESELDAKGYLTDHQSLEAYATKVFVTDEISKIEIPSISGLATETYVDEAIRAIEIPEIPANVSAFNNDAGYLTEHQDISGKADKSELFSKDYNDLINTPEIPSIAGLASETYVQEEIAKINIPEPDLSNYYNKEEVETLVENIEHPKQTYYLDFTSTVPKQPETLTDEIKEAATQVIAGKQIAIYLRDDKVADSYLNNYGAGTVKLIESDTYYQIDFGRVARSHTAAGGITANWDYTYSLLCSKTNSSFFQYTATASKQEFVTQSYVTTAIKNITPPTVPTKLSELTNDVPYATEQYVTDAIAAIQEPVEEVKSTLNTTVLPKVEKVDEIVPVVETLKTTAATQEWVESKKYTTEAKVIELLENNAGAKIGIDFVTDIAVGHLAAGTEIKASMTISEILYKILTATVQPEEPTAKLYYLGGIGNDTQQDIPTLWESYGFDIPTRATHYLDYMKSNDAREYTEDSLVGQHELSWTLRTPLGFDQDLTDAMGEDIYITESDSIYPAVALPTGYKVIAWSTDAENSYPVANIIDSVETPTGYTIYYVQNAFRYGETKTFFITIE